MTHTITRREFVANMAAGATFAGALPHALLADQQHENSFSILLLGDTHFDRMEHHDLEWMREHYAKDIVQVENYCRHTRDLLPELLRSARKRLAAADPATAFTLHVGDLIEGICGNKDLAIRHCEEGWEYFKNADLSVPLLMTKGNHDITGPGAVDAYREVLLQETAKELGRNSLENTSYSFKQGDNLFAVFDAYDRAAIDWLEDVVRENEFHRLFLLLHLPVVPYNARADWRVYYHERQASRRQRLVDLLGRHRAIVLCGHLHKTSLLVRRCRSGKFVQLAMSSVVKNSNGKRQPTLSSMSDYGANLTELEPAFSPETLDARQQILTREKPFVEHFEYADQSGFAILSITENEVQAEIHDAANPNGPCKAVSLTRLLDA